MNWIEEHLGGPPAHYLLRHENAVRIDVLVHARRVIEMAMHAAGHRTRVVPADQALAQSLS